MRVRGQGQGEAQRHLQQWPLLLEQPLRRLQHPSVRLARPARPARPARLARLASQRHVFAHEVSEHVVQPHRAAHLGEGWGEGWGVGVRVRVSIVALTASTTALASWSMASRWPGR